MLKLSRRDSGKDTATTTCTYLLFLKLGTLSNGDGKDVRLGKNQFIFYRRITSIGLRSCPSLTCNASVQFQMKIRKISRRRPRPLKYPELDHFTLLLCRGRLRNVPSLRIIMHVHSYCPLNLLFGGVLVAVAVVVCLRALLENMYLLCRATIDG